MMIIKALREYFLDCPILEEAAKINVDFLEVDPTNYTLDGVPADPIVKMYADGGKIKQFLFVFASKEYYGPDVLQNIDNSGFYEKLSDWFEEQNEIGNLPELNNKRALKIETLTSGYLFGSDENSARYQLQGRLLYYED